jgi:hypothetical protein
LRAEKSPIAPAHPPAKPQPLPISKAAITRIRKGTLPLGSTSNHEYGSPWKSAVRQVISRPLLLSAPLDARGNECMLGTRPSREIIASNRSGFSQIRPAECGGFARQAQSSGIVEPAHATMLSAFLAAVMAITGAAVSFTPSQAATMPRISAADFGIGARNGRGGGAAQTPPAAPGWRGSRHYGGVTTTVPRYSTRRHYHRRYYPPAATAMTTTSGRRLRLDLRAGSGRHHRRTGAWQFQLPRSLRPQVPVL